MHPELAHFHVLENALADCEHLLLHFRGPVCDLSVRPVTAVTGRLRDLLADQGVPLPQAVRAASDPYVLLRFILAVSPRLAARAEAEICQQEILAAAAARPSPGIRTWRGSGTHRDPPVHCLFDGMAATAPDRQRLCGGGCQHAAQIAACFT
jgi:hypothetical protein